MSLGRHQICHVRQPRCERAKKGRTVLVIPSVSCGVWAAAPKTWGRRRGGLSRSPKPDEHLFGDLAAERDGLAVDLHVTEDKAGCG